MVPLPVPPEIPAHVDDIISLRTEIIDQKNNHLRWWNSNNSTDGIYLTDGLTIKLAYDKYDVHVGDLVTAFLSIENGDLSDIRYTMLNTSMYSENMKWDYDMDYIDWKIVEPGLFSYQFEVKDWGQFAVLVAWGDDCWRESHAISVKR